MNFSYLLKMAVQEKTSSGSNLKPEFFGISSRLFHEMLNQIVFVDTENPGEIDIYIHLTPDIFFIEDGPPNVNPIMNTSTSFGWKCRIQKTREGGLEIVLDKNNNHAETLFEKYVVGIILDSASQFITDGGLVYDA